MNLQLMLLRPYTLAVSHAVYLKSRRGQTLVEYGLILALVALVTISVLTLLGTRLRNIFSRITQTLSTV